MQILLIWVAMTQTMTFGMMTGHSVSLPHSPPKGTIIIKYLLYFKHFKYNNKLEIIHLPHSAETSGHVAAEPPSQIPESQVLSPFASFQWPEDLVKDIGTMQDPSDILLPSENSILPSAAIDAELPSSGKLPLETLNSVAADVSENKKFKPDTYNEQDSYSAQDQQAVGSMADIKRNLKMSLIADKLGEQLLLNPVSDSFDKSFQKIHDLYKQSKAIDKDQLASKMELIVDIRDHVTSWSETALRDIVEDPLFMVWIEHLGNVELPRLAIVKPEYLTEKYNILEDYQRARAQLIFFKKSLKHKAVDLLTKSARYRDTMKAKLRAEARRVLTERDKLESKLFDHEQAVFACF